MPWLLRSQRPRAPDCYNSVVSTRPIIHAPHPSLRAVAKPVTNADTKMLQLQRNLGETLMAHTNPQGVGLAAPQINEKWRMFVTYLESSESDQPQLKAFVNVRLIDRAEKEVVGVSPRDPDLEGCLSIPHLYAPVLRPEWVTLEYQTLEPDMTLSDFHTMTFFDFTARVMQHELDHLDGILFTDHVLKQGQPLYESRGRDLVSIDPELVQGF